MYHTPDAHSTAPQPVKSGLRLPREKTLQTGRSPVARMGVSLPRLSRGPGIRPEPFQFPSRCRLTFSHT